MKTISLLDLDDKNKEILNDYKKELFSKYNICSSFLFLNSIFLEEKSFKDKLYLFPSTIEFEKGIYYSNNIAYLKLKTKLDFVNFSLVDGLPLCFTTKKIPEVSLVENTSLRYQEAKYALDENNSEFIITFDKRLSKEFR